MYAIGPNGKYIGLHTVTRNGLAGWFHQSTHSYKLAPQLGFDHKFKLFPYALPNGAPTSFELPDTGLNRNQGDIGSCTCQSTCGAYEQELLGLGAKTKAKSAKLQKLSALLLYLQCRDVQSTPNEDSGSTVAIAIDRIVAVGTCLDSLFTDDDAHFIQNGVAVRPPVDVWGDAYDARTKQLAWGAIPDNDRSNGVIAALLAGHSPTFESPLDSTIWGATPDHVLPIPNANDIIGGHAVRCVGYRDLGGPNEAYKMRTSWGDDFCDHGGYWISRAWLDWTAADGLFVLDLSGAK